MMLLASLLSYGCSSSIGASQSLPAPTNFAYSAVSDAATWRYTFAFSAVESAQSYAIYYSLAHDLSVARPVASGPFPPVTWFYNHANAYGRQPVHFWVRAFDGKNYGQWSSPIPGTLE